MLSAQVSATIGLTITDAFPFTVVSVLPESPSAKGGFIQAGHELHKIDSSRLQAHMTGDQVRSMLVGPSGSVVELVFTSKAADSQGQPSKTAFRVKLKRKEIATDLQQGSQDNVSCRSRDNLLDLLPVANVHRV